MRVRWMAVSVFFIVGVRCSPDAGTGQDAEVADGGGDSTTSDGASADASDGGVDLSCANVLPGTVLCDDFDAPDAGSPKDKWSSELSFNGFNMFDTTVFRSSPRSYRPALFADDAGATADSALLVQALGGISNATLTARVNVRVHATDPSKPCGLLEVSYAPAVGTKVSAAFVADNGQWALVIQANGSSVTSNDVLGTIAMDVWVLLQIDMSPTQVVASIDGVVVKTVSGALAAPASKPYAGVELGILSGSTSFVTQVNFDDFLFRIQ